MSFSKTILLGRMVADPELKQSAGGLSVTSFTVAVNRRGKNNETDFIDCVAWRQQAEFVSRYFKKGNPILVSGQLQTRKYTDRQNVTRTVYEVIVDEVSFAESAGQSNNTTAEPRVSTPQNSAPQSVPKPAQQTSYIPNAYTGGTNVSFEDVPDDSDFPF